MRHPFRRRLLAARLLPLYALAALCFWRAEPTPSWLAAGGALASAGAALRAWGAGHLVKTARFAVSGPYAYLRHPLYAGSLLVGLGLGAAGGATSLALACGVFVPFFLLYYLPYKDRIEGARLERRYGETYAAWRSAVPALWPRLAPWRPAGSPERVRDARWSAARFRANDEGGALLAIACAFALLVLRGAAG